ncbi:MAG: DEAD/DEAH box helicase family protein, partial [Lachnospiraceae bacterium]|nr:DEAD/DEAH box helicase family protein [Lachnospiraceae bacterium]
MPYLYEKIDGIREAGRGVAMPADFPRNLNPSFELRPYQIAAFENFFTYFESSELRIYPAQTLFHMATGSGKTLIMAGLILYLYKKGYRDFLFFVNLSNIVQKTKDNFLNVASSKYLFAQTVIIGGESVAIKEVSNFQYSDPDAINICFTTTQGLHTDLWMTKENSLSLEDFAERKVVLISDEAHHLNAETLQGNTAKMNAEEADAYHSWESTVRTIFEANPENVLLEFTATCDIKNPLLRKAYENKIIFDYPLYKFRADRYSKEIMTLRSDLSLLDRELQAVILSQYRLKVFQDQRILMKPVVLFKAAKIAESKQQQMDFQNMIDSLSGADIARIATTASTDVMKRAFAYFKKKKISFEQLAQELKVDFSEAHVTSANDDREAEEQQLLLNSLEDYENPYRAIFEVKKLDEGWDVLNLFDIVRLYETKEAKSGKLARSTVSEAQLIGRGARYYPFQLTPDQPKFQRKFDEFGENTLRICEELYYHCQNSSKYIEELKSALR